MMIETDKESEEYTFEYTKKYASDIVLHKKSGQKKLLDKIASFLEELSKHPITGTGQVEPLKGYSERNVYSRRIDKKHRLIYEVFEDKKRVALLSAYGHYDDE
ncbi:Txe/YoeB family addiction module toxin [Capnocytophaga bilenii]|mgnify:FL=1